MSGQLCCVLSHWVGSQALCKCIAAGYFYNSARLHPDGTYRTLRDERTVRIHPSSVLFAEAPPNFIVFGEEVST